MPVIPIDDRGVSLGVGLFETLLAIDGRPVFWAEHMARLARGCTVLDLPAPEPAACLAAAKEALSAAGLANGRAALRLTWTGGAGERGLDPPAAPRPNLFASAHRAAPPPASLRLATAQVRRNPSSPSSRLKTLSYLDNVAARAQARAKGADEALMLDQEGRLACLAAANLFWVEDDTLCTPALDCGVLDGVVRRAVLRLAAESGWRCEELHAPAERLPAAHGVFATNSLIGAVPVVELDGLRLTGIDPRLAELMRRASILATTAGG